MINRTILRWGVFLLVLLFVVSGFGQPSPVPDGLTLSRPAHTWEFLPAVGEKAALLGHETGTMEAWIYPMKIFRDFRLVFHVGNRTFPAESLVRTVEVHPEAVTLVYAGDTFQVKETFLTPRSEPGAVIALDVTAFESLAIEARFQPDFQLIWPAAMGGTYANWEPALHAFTFGEEQKKWFAMVGASDAENTSTAFDTNYYAENTDAFRLAFDRGRSRKLIVVSGSVKSRDEMLATYNKLASQYDALRKSAAQDYAAYLSRTTSLSLPDRQLQDAYDWSRVSVLQGLVSNPFLGTGLVAGYRTSGPSGRPGFAWFFGRDSEWTSFALNSEGDFDTAKAALDFISKYQRQDGKIPHEISQAAAQVPWFTGFPYPWASADATPLFIIAVRDYYEHSGDTEFVTSHWDNLWRAYQFLRSTWDENGIPKNFGVGHGWVEGGPLVPVKSEFYQAGLGAEALNALATLAVIADKKDVAAETARLFAEKKTQVNDVFWDPQDKFYSFALDLQNKRVDTPTVLTTVPMWFGITDPQKTDATITRLADADHMSDWGMRIISSKDPLYDPSGYHFGSVWPLFTGWASVAEYRYHRPLPAYENLRANALLALNGSTGHTTEVLSGSFYEQLSTASPHQIWSAAMVVSPILRGMLGISANLSNKRLTVAPHLPGDWTWWKANNVRIGSATVDLAYNYSGSAITLIVTPKQSSGMTLEFAPAVSPRARVGRVEVNGRTAKFTIDKSNPDRHVVVTVPLESPSTIRIPVEDDFALSLPQDLPQYGAASKNLKVVSQTWSPTNDAVTYELAGVSGMNYEVGVHGSLASVEGGELSSDRRTLRVTIPPGEPGYRHARLTIHFGR